MRKLRFAFIIFSVSILISCVDEFNFSTENLSTKIEQSATFAVPLIDASISLDEILNNDSTIEEKLIIDENKFISLQYIYSYAEFPATEFFKGDYNGNNLPYYSDIMQPKTVKLGFNNLINHGELYLSDPKVTVSVINYWFIPTRFKFTEFKYFLEENSVGIPFTGSITSQWFTVNLPATANGSAVTEIELNKTNSNIDQVISMLPHHIAVGANYETIPGGPYNIKPASIDSVKIKLDVPLDLKATDLRLTDTLDFKLGENIEDTTILQSLKLNLIFDNGFPLSLDAQLYFTDENYNILDSISNEGISIPSGKTTAGKVTEITHYINPSVNFDYEKINTLLKAKYLIISVRFNTTNSNLGESVKLYSNYALGFKVGALVELDYKLQNK